MTDTSSDKSDYVLATAPYQSAIGRVAIAWNGMIEALAMLYAILHAPLPQAIPYAAWNALRSDLSQREMLKAVAAVRFHPDLNDGPSWAKKFPTALSDIVDLVDRIN